MRVAVLGTGRMGAFRAEALRRRDDVDEVVVSSGDRARGRPVDEALDGADAVVISSATPDHAGQIAACAARGLPVLCEKPLGLTLADTAAAIEAAGRAGTLLQVAFMRRFDPGFAAARRAKLGTLYCARFSSHDREPSPGRFIPGSGGIFRDLLVHDFDMARWLTGLEVETVYAVGSVRRWRRFEPSGDADTAAVLLTMEGGVPVTMTATRHHPQRYEVRCELLGSDDAVVVDAEPCVGFVERFALAFEAEMTAWLEAVRGERENPCPGSEALHALRVAVAAERSRAEGRAVRLAEVDDG